MPSRRDILRILLLGSGALYVGPRLGSCTRSEQSLSRASSQRQTVGHQFFDTPHHYIRDHQTSTLKWHSARKHVVDVAIVGAGPAGLAAALRLQTDGYQIALIENEPIAGGAARSGNYNTVQYPLAAIYFVERRGDIEELCRFAGVEPIPVPEDTLILEQSSFANVWDDATLSSLPITQREKSELRRFRDDLLGLRESERLPEYPLPETLPDDWKALDSMSAADYVARYRSPLLRALLDLYTRSSMGGSLENVNAFALLNFYASEIATQRYTFPGGLAGLASPLITKMGDAVKTQMTCIRISTDGPSVMIWALDRDGQMHRFDCRAAIVAVQKFMLPWILPDLPSAQQAAMRSLQYAPFLTVHLCAEQPLLPNGFDVWVPSGGQLFTDIINANATANRSQQTSFVASIYAPRTMAERAIMQSDDVLAAYARKIADHAARSVPTIHAETIEEVHVFGWGHALVVPVPGSHSGLAQAARQRFGRIVFANTDNDSSPAFENAVAHGTSAAEAAIGLLKQ